MYAMPKNNRRSISGYAQHAKGHSRCTQSGLHARRPCPPAGRRSGSGPGVSSDIPVPEGAAAVPPSLALHFGRLDTRRVGPDNGGPAAVSRPGQRRVAGAAARRSDMMWMGV